MNDFVMNTYDVRRDGLPDTPIDLRRGHGEDTFFHLVAPQLRRGDFKNVGHPHN